MLTCILNVYFLNHLNMQFMKFHKQYMWSQYASFRNPEKTISEKEYIP